MQDIVLGSLTEQSMCIYFSMYVCLYIYIYAHMYMRFMSRAKFLEKQATLFNKKQKDCFIVIKTLTEDQLFMNLEKKKWKH